MVAGHLAFAFLSILLAFLPSAAAVISNETFQQLTESLSSNGYDAMALTLQYGPKNILSTPYSTLTIFAPQDSAFSLNGQPSLSLLYYHLCPLYIPLSSLKGFPLGTQIPTLSRNASLFITSSSSGSVNGVNIDDPAIYDDGFVVVYGIERFFDMNFQVSEPHSSGTPDGHELSCSVPPGDGRGHGHHRFEEASEVLRSRGFTLAASFLDLQMGNYEEENKNRTMTIFAPRDRALSRFQRDHGNLRRMVLRHLIPCRIPMRILTNLDDGSMLSTYQEGFFLRTTRTKFGTKVNGVQFVAPDMYSSDWLIIHGVNGIIGSEEDALGARTANSSRKLALNSILLLSLVVGYLHLACFVLDRQ